MTDSEIQEMRDQIKKESETDPMDGGIVVPDGGDGIKRIPTDPTGMPMDPSLPADDRAKMALGIMPGEEGEQSPPEGEVPPEQ
jgi:hypothetical protein